VAAAAAAGSGVVTRRTVGLAVALAAVAFFLILGVPALWAQSPSVLIEDWGGQPVGKTGVPEGWKPQNWGSPRFDFRIIHESPTKVLHLKSDNDGSLISKEVKIDLTQHPMLHWRWKVVRLPAGADSRKKDTDDQGIQLYVTFPRFPAAVRSRTIGYVWDTSAPAGLIVRSEKASTVTYVIMRSGEAGLGQWVAEARDVYQDFKKIYGEEPAEPVGVISVAIDSNDTRSRAESYMGEIVFKRR
jgi:hypothetical protein